MMTILFFWQGVYLILISNYDFLRFVSLPWVWLSTLKKKLWLSNARMTLMLILCMAIATWRTNTYLSHNQFGSGGILHTLLIMVKGENMRTRGEPICKPWLSWIQLYPLHRPCACLVFQKTKHTIQEASTIVIQLVRIQCVSIFDRVGNWRVDPSLIYLP